MRAIAGGTVKINSYLRTKFGHVGQIRLSNAKHSLRSFFSVANPATAHSQTLPAMPFGQMRFQISILTVFLIPTILYGQTVKKYSFDNFDSYVFSDKHTHQLTYDIKDKTGYFTPDSLDILTIEAEIIKQKETFNSIKGRKKGLTNFDRQYFGYLKTNGDRIIIISFINTDKGDKGKELKKSIDSDLIIGFGDWFEKNTFRLSYNMTTNQLSEY